MKFKVDDVVTWTSQAAGVSKIKTGRIVALLVHGYSIREALNRLGADGAASVVHACDTSSHDRYLVQARETKTRRHFYAPNAILVDRQMSETQATAQP